VCFESVAFWHSVKILTLTYRNLLTHTSGLAYEFTHPKLNAWREWAMSSTPDGRVNARSSEIAVANKVPLIFEPDEGWVYGYGIDWAGLAVMRATKQTLEEYMSENIWKPCGMASTTFQPYGSQTRSATSLRRHDNA
jgi:CubicO group peptidase (beta-lactamase class C family)